jgi:iron uptake system EfeUOB component EfeO/EfeM
MAESKKGLTELEETELNILREIEENEGKVTEIIARRRSIIKDGFKDYEKVNNAQREFVNL